MIEVLHCKDCNNHLLLVALLPDVPDHVHIVCNRCKKTVYCMQTVMREKCPVVAKETQ